MTSILHALHKKIGSYRAIFTVENSIIAIYFCLGLIGILHHEMWRDEMQAWLIARDSNSLTELLDNMRYEGHPALWHMCLYVLSQFTHNPLIVQLFHLLIALGFVILFVKFSPFNIFKKLVFPFGYFIFYEYCIVSRNYSLGVFFLFLFCVFYTRNKQNYIVLGVILALLANVNAFVLIISFVIFMALLIQALCDRKKYLNSRTKCRNLAIGTSITLSGWVISAIQIERGASGARSLHTASVSASQVIQKETIQEVSINETVFEELKRFVLELGNIWRSYIPIPNLSHMHFWNNNFLLNSGINDAFEIAGFEIGKILAITLSLVIVMLCLWLLSNHFISFFIYGCGTLGIILFSHLFLEVPVSRHYGHLFILFIVALWLANYDQQVNNFSIPQNSVQLRWRSQWLSVFLCLQLVAGLYAYRTDLVHPFSTMKLAADYLQSHGLQDQFILGHRYRQAAVLAGYLDRKIFYPENQQLGSFWSIREREIQSEEELLGIVQDVQRQNTTGMVLVLTRPIDPPPELNISELTHFEGAIEPSESAVYLYQAQNSVLLSQ